MRTEGRVLDGPMSKQTIDGPRRIHVRDGAVFMEQQAPRYLTQQDWAATGVTEADILSAVGLREDRLDHRVAPQVVDTGNRFLLIGVASEADLAGITVDQRAVARISDALDLIGFYVFFVTGKGGVAHATTRMFAPRYGISEESATGMAAGPLACLLHDVLGERRTHFIIEQGRFMPCPSVSRILVDLEVKGGAITALMAGGKGQVVRTLQIEPGQVAPADRLDVST